MTPEARRAFPVAMVAIAEAEAIFRLAPGPASGNEIDFSCAPWTTGKLEVNVDALTAAVAHLAARLRSEVEARLALETRVNGLSCFADDAGEVGEASAGAAGEAGGAAGVGWADGGRGSGEDLQGAVERLGKDLAYFKRQSEQGSRTADVLRKLELDAIRRDVMARARSADVDQLGESILAKAKALIADETRAGVADLQESLKRVDDAWGERLRLLEERVDELEASLQVRDLQAEKLASELADLAALRPVTGNSVASTAMPSGRVLSLASPFSDAALAADGPGQGAGELGGAVDGDADAVREALAEHKLALGGQLDDLAAKLNDQLAALRLEFGGVSNMAEQTQARQRSLEDRLDALRAESSELAARMGQAAGGGVARNELDELADALRAEITALLAGMGQEMLAKIEDLRVDMAALEHRLATAGAAPFNGFDRQELDDLAQRVKSLENFDPAQLGKRLDARMQALELQFAASTTPTMWKKMSDSLKQLYGDFCRLKERVEALEHPENVSYAPKAGEGAPHTHAAGGDELQNLYIVVRALQRDASLQGVKVEGLADAVASVKASVEAALPHVLRFVEDLLKAQGAAGPGTKFEGTRLEELFDQLGAAGVPLRYATCEAQEALKTDISDLEKRLRDEVCQLSSTIGQLLRGKADCDDVNALIGKLNFHSKDHKTGGVDDVIEQTALIRTPLGPARCLACDRKLDVVSSRPNPWDRGGSPAGHRPQREPGCPAHTPTGPPLGYRQRRERDLALPAIEAEGALAVGGHSRPPPHS